MKVIKYVFIGILLIGISGCSTVAKRENGETLKITGFGKAEWPDGAKIEGKPMVDFSGVTGVYERVKR